MPPGGTKLFLKGEHLLTDECGIERRNYPPGEHGRGRARQSEYRVQLREKQKARRFYGVLEKQFRTYYAHASRQAGVTAREPAPPARVALRTTCSCVSASPARAVRRAR